MLHSDERNRWHDPRLLHLQLHGERHYRRPMWCAYSRAPARRFGAGQQSHPSARPRLTLATSIPGLASGDTFDFITSTQGIGRALVQSAGFDWNGNPVVPLTWATVANAMRYVYVRLRSAQFHLQTGRISGRRLPRYRSGPGYRQSFHRYRGPIRRGRSAGRAAELMAIA